MAEKQNKITYGILESYRDESSDGIRSSVALIGLGALIGSVFMESTPLAIGGGVCIGVPFFGGAMEYGKAYLEARLDYLKNDEFARLRD